MGRATKLLIAVLWIVSLAAVGMFAQGRSAGKTEPEVIAGPDVGFRVDHYKGDTPVGELVVKKDGKWVPVEFAGRLKMVK